MKCPVCGKEMRTMVCPQCGFDRSTDHEKYPTFSPVGKVPSVSSLRREWAQKHPEPKEKPVIPPPPEPKPQRNKPCPTIAACAAMLVLAIGIGAGLGGRKPEPAKPSDTLQIQEPMETTTAPPETPLDHAPWRNNILRSDEPVDADADGNFSVFEAPQAPVFDSEYRRDQIRSVTFLDTLAIQPEDAWDVSEAGDRSVMAWVKPNGDLYDLYISAEGGVAAGESCAGLFAGYQNAEHIILGNAFHTENAQNMSLMFYRCSSLTALTLGSSFYTANVHNMNFMFWDCLSLTNLTLSNSFDTSNVQGMSHMFYNCYSLTELTLGNSFDTANVQDMAYIFYNCPAGADYHHLLH